MKSMFEALRLFLVMTVLLGFAYPLTVLLGGQVLWTEKANGSLIHEGDRVVGSHLIGQKFETPRYFHGRPSASAYNALPSGGTNLGPTSKKLKENVVLERTRIGANAPGELLYASGSGLDPHISPLAARFQIERVSEARKLDAIKRAELQNVVESSITNRDLGFLGEPTVNVLELNLAVDQLLK